MNYQKIYENLINNAKSQNRVKLKKDNPDYVYYEKHHILPRCAHGDEHKDNLVLLTAKEHFLAHKLLIKIYPEIRGLRLAIHRMMHGIQKEHLILSSRDYELSKELFRGKYNPRFGKKQSKETKLKIGNANKIALMGNKLSEETKKKISEGNKGKKRSAKAKERYSKAKIGKRHSDESIKKISESNRGQIPWNKGMKMPEEFSNKTKKGIKEKRNLNPKYTNRFKIKKDPNN